MKPLDNFVGPVLDERMTAPRPQHALDTPCPCGHAAWLHVGGRCVAQIGSDSSQMAFKACECARGLKEFS